MAIVLPNEEAEPEIECDEYGFDYDGNPCDPNGGDGYDDGYDIEDVGSRTDSIGGSMLTVV